MRPTLIFRFAVAVIALHALADALIGLEPGVARTDHLTAVLVPGAILLAAALVFPGARPGLQAALALSLGFLALVGAGAATAGALDQGIDPAAATGLLLVPAGLGLLGLGGTLLWRSRRMDGRRYPRRILIAVGAAVVWFELLLPVGLAVIATHRPPGDVVAADLARPYDEVSVQTDDGLGLSGWYVRSENGAGLVVYPEREGTAAHARLLAEAGYGVLALDARGYGTSEGDPNSYGWGASEDVEAGVDFLSSRPEIDPGRIGALGLSVGGEQAIEAAAADERIAAVVSDGAGERSVRETVLFGAEAALAIPQSAVLTAAVASLSGDAPPPALDEMAGSVAPRSLLLIEAENGQGGEELNERYFEAAGEPKEHWVVAGSSHTGGINAQHAAYRRRVLSFLSEALPRRP